MKDALIHGNTGKMALYILDTKMKPLGKIKLSNCAARRFYTFFDLRLRNKLNIVPIIGVDYSLANLTFRDDMPLQHTLKEGCSNDYVDALKGIYKAFEALAQFMVAYGFAACTVKSDNACNLFSLTGDFADPYINSEQELINSYSGTIKNVTMSLPVRFKNLVKFVCDLAQTELGTASDATQIGNYYVLTILMAGVIDDFEEALNEILRAAQLPVSIIIVKIGTIAHNENDSTQLMADS